MADLAYRLSGAHHFGQHLQGGHQPIAGGREIRHHDMARLLAADIEPVLAHVFDDITVADLGARQRQLHFGEMAFEAEIGHDGGDDPAAGEPLLAMP